MGKNVYLRLGFRFFAEQVYMLYSKTSYLFELDFNKLASKRKLVN